MSAINEAQALPAHLLGVGGSTRGGSLSLLALVYHPPHWSIEVRTEQ